ncbi:DUF1753-domain-containing protein [Piedraia hortae CBS 480.64]|uniref:DUF1753-domain-containing protein n=1 Tax=Piedraia hortae CBS 480.64 TaxID=1314780 RepID=A0A6A7C980_9PEZI|nr:DUF1753-domain-containing protein [Piedraia hortae CBS 480.64]
MSQYRGYSQSFLRLTSLLTATEFILFVLAINKVTGLYGILALFTGYNLTPLQLSHYIYSLLALGAAAYLWPSLRDHGNAQGLLKCVALAWVYVLDTAINSAYTGVFGGQWFLTLARHLNDGDRLAAQGGDGFTNPEHKVGSVDILAASEGRLKGSTVIVGTHEGIRPPGGAALLQSGSLASIAVVTILWTCRIYACLVVLAYARSAVRGYLASQGGEARNPFREDCEDGRGWKGALGRMMLRFPTTGYWLGDPDGPQYEWARATNLRFNSHHQSRGLKIKVPSSYGVSERERRARSGTGPPIPLSEGKSVE